MSVIRGLAAGAAGAAAYNAYQDVDLSSGKGIAAGLYEAFQRKGAHQMAEVRLFFWQNGREGLCFCV